MLRTADVDLWNLEVEYVIVVKKHVTCILQAVFILHTVFVFVYMQFCTFLSYLQLQCMWFHWRYFPGPGLLYCTPARRGAAGATPHLRP